jgi:hypothetical protein
VLTLNGLLQFVRKAARVNDPESGRSEQILLIEALTMIHSLDRL